MSQLEPFMSSGPLPPSRHRRTWGRRIAALVAVLVAVVMVGTSIVWLRSGGATEDYTGSGTGEAVIIIARGDTLTAIAGKLADAGVVADAAAWIDAASVDDRSASIGPGKYTLRKQMSAQSALDLMLDPASRADSRLVLPEGLRLEQTVARAAEATSLPKSDFQKVLRDPSGLGLPTWARNRPEGFMFPATYDLTGDETAESVLTALVTRFNQAESDIGIEERAKNVGLTPYQVLIVASLIQAEAAPADFTKVARVIYNRLDRDMPLQLDSTVSYALGVTDLTLSAAQLATPSAYNTYLHKGLPPRPINSPGAEAIEAALSPANGKWLYFVLVDPTSRETAFARTYEKFLELKAQYQENLAKAEASGSGSPSPEPSPSDTASSGDG